MSIRKKLVVTGAGGFLGSHLLARVKEAGEYSVVALSSRPEELRGQLGGANIEYRAKDDIFGSAAAEFLRGAQVVNCAYPRTTSGAAIADGLSYVRRVFEAAAENHAASILNISSQSVYSQQRTDVADEGTPLSLESAYAVGKYAVELMLASICRGTGVRHTSLRLASLIGPGFGQRIVNRFVVKMLNHESITVVRQPKRLGFLDVEDAVSAILSLVACPLEHWRAVYTVGSGIGYTVEEIYAAVADCLGDESAGAPPVFEEGDEVSNTAVSFERLRADTGFAPAVDLRESILRIRAQLRGEQP